MKTIRECPADLQLRDARPPEHAAITELTRRAYAQYATIMTPAAWAGLEAAVQQALAAQDRAADGIVRIVAERAGIIVGSVSLYAPAANAYGGEGPRAACPEVRLLAVAPEVRGSGVGEALMRECVRRARETGARELGLHTSRSMQAAMRMYQRMGFVRVPEHDFQPPGAELVEAYRLRLD
jgi:ribosomal protein S18 acetylase RimI-like enzyme